MVEENIDDIRETIVALMIDQTQACVVTRMLVATITTTRSSRLVHPNDDRHGGS